MYFSVSQSELSLASQEELTEVINFLSGAPIKLRLLNEDDTNTSMAESHMTPIDSGLGSIYSVALSSVTQVDNKGTTHDAKPSDSQSDPKENSSCTVDVAADSSKDMKLPSTEMVSMETQTSPTTEACPILFVKPANAEDQEGDGSSVPSVSSEQDSQVMSKDSIKGDSEGKLDDDIDDKEKSTTPQASPSSSPPPPSPSQQLEEDETIASDGNAGNSSEIETAAKVSTGNEDQMLSPMLVTVSSEEGDDDKAVSISESLRYGHLTLYVKV